MVNRTGSQLVNDGGPRAVSMALRCLLVCLVLGCSVVPQTMQPASAGGPGEGTIVGIVLFSGVPCPPDRLKVPPCDGPYPDYEVIIYKHDGMTVAARIRTDKEGGYRVAVPSGTYVIYSRGLNLSGKTEDIPNTIAVEEGKSTQFNVRIDTGIQ